MSNLPSRSNWPYCDSTYPDAFSGERDSCGVGFIANVEGKQNNWVLSQALRGLSCMEHRGGCGGDGDSGDGAGILCEIPWSYLSQVWDTAKQCDPHLSGIGMIFMPKDSFRSTGCT